MPFFSFLLDALFPTRRTERTVERASPDALFVRTMPTIVEHAEYEWVALLPYKDPLVAAHIIEAKYHHNKRAQEALAHVLGEYLAAYTESIDSYSSTPFSVVPVPLSVQRHRERGYNQAEEVCAKALAYLDKNASVTHALHRTRDTRQQTRLSRDARVKNIQGAFEGICTNPSRTYLIVDDVITTGATMEAACKALTKAGATRVIGVALAH